jgi:hypothetical protein
VDERGEVLHDDDGDDTITEGSREYNSSNPSTDLTSLDDLQAFLAHLNLSEFQSDPSAISSI